MAKILKKIILASLIAISFFSFSLVYAGDTNNAVNVDDSIHMYNALQNNLSINDLLKIAEQARKHKELLVLNS